MHYSRYLVRLLDRRPEWNALVDEVRQQPVTRESLEAELAGPFADKDQLHHALRLARQRVMLSVIVRDVAGIATLDEVVSIVTALAEIALRVALDHHARWLEATFGAPLNANGDRQQLIVVGMGKLEEKSSTSPRTSISSSCFRMMEKLRGRERSATRSFSIASAAM